MNSIIEAQIELKEQCLFEMERCLDVQYFMDNYIEVDIVGGTEAYNRAFKVISQANLFDSSSSILEKEGLKITGHIIDFEKGLIPIYEITDKGIRESYRHKFKPIKDER